ncbi:unnamed protein product [Hyaloperonospora brassicae]|uniref:Tetratricopeptide repeat protein n=1 Tax=Hyaloperonospora brassicae TaxID=162125 RepID=A0AAV0SUE3_HYABA|nr:unnamed protein product [Hyaloperonospora brassicae]
MPSTKVVVVALYRSLLQSAKVLDTHAAFKAVLPREVEWHHGSKWCDFFGSGSSCTDAVRSGFRGIENTRDIDNSLDEALQINKMVLERVQLLYCDEGDRHVLRFAEVLHPTTFDEKYEWEKQQLNKEKEGDLCGALELIQSASALLASEDLDMADRTRLAKAYYVESLKLFETADAHAYLGWHFYLDGKVDEAVRECQRAIQMDPAFGNPYNDLGLIRVAQGKAEEALQLLLQAIAAPRNDVRHYACQNLAALHLENNRVKPALHKYIESLYWIGPNEQVATAIRNTISDLGDVVIALASCKNDTE